MAEIGRFVDRQDRKRRERGEQAAAIQIWEESARRYEQTNARAALEDRLQHARSMLRSHTLTFQVLLERWSREVDRLERSLGIAQEAGEG